MKQVITKASDIAPMLPANAHDKFGTNSPFKDSDRFRKDDDVRWQAALRRNGLAS